MNSIFIQKAKGEATDKRSFRFLPMWAGILLGAIISAIGFKLSPEMILVFSGATIASVAGMISPSLAFILVVLTVPIERMGRLLDDSAVNMISFMRIIGLLAFLSYGVHALINRWKPRFGSPLIFYCGYCVIAAVTLLYANDLGQSLRVLGMIIGNLLFFFLITNVVRSWNLIQLAMRAWILVSVLIGIFTIWTWHTPGPLIQESEVGMMQARFVTTYADGSEWASLGQVKRAVGPTSSPGVYGINMILTIPFLFYLLRSARSLFHKALCFFAFGIVLYNIVLTNTRATIICGIIALALSIIFGLYPVTRARLIAFCLILLIIIPVIPAEVIHRALSPANYTIDQSATMSARFVIWDAWLKAAQEHWLAGVGIGDNVTLSRYINQEDIPIKVSAHNEFFATFLEVGIFGWLLFMGFLGSVLWTTRSAMRYFRKMPEDQPKAWFLNAGQVCFFTVVLFGLQADVLHLPLKGWWLIAGLSYCLYLNARSRHDAGLRQTSIISP